MALVVLVSGCSSAGKSTFAQRVRERLAVPLATLHEDDFYYAATGDGAAALAAEGEPNWDAVEAIDEARFARAAEAALLALERSSCTRGTVTAAALVVEGTRVEQLPRLRDALHGRGDDDAVAHDEARVRHCLVWASRATCRARRGARRYDGAPDPAAYFDTVVWPAFTERLRKHESAFDMVVVTDPAPADGHKAGSSSARGARLKDGRLGAPRSPWRAATWPRITIASRPGSVLPGRGRAWRAAATAAGAHCRHRAGHRHHLALDP